MGPTLDELLRKSSPHQGRLLSIVLASEGLLALVVCILPHPRPDIWLGFDLVAMALGGIVSTSILPDGLIWRWAFIGIFIALSIVGVTLVIQQSNESEKAQAALNNRINNLQAELTGDGSFAYVRVVPSEQDDIATLWLIHHGDFPLHGLEITITDIDQIGPVLKQRPLDTKALWAGYRVFHVPELLAHTAQNRNAKYVFKGTDRRAFNVWFMAPNGKWAEALRERRVNNQWYCALTVQWQYPPDKVKLPRFELIDKQYPEKDKINWR